MLEKYRHHFDCLEPEEVRLTTEGIADLHGCLMSPTLSGLELWNACGVQGFDQADVVMSLVKQSPTVVGDHCIETLIGRPIVRSVPKKQKKQTISRSPKKVNDNRRIVHVAPNPKKPGSLRYDRYERYVVGRTISESVAAGVRLRDINTDLERNYIKLEE